MIDYQEALKTVLAQTFPLKTEKIRLEDAIGRVLSEKIIADRDYPPFNRSAMDGFAFRYADLEKTENPTFEVVETIFPAQENTKSLKTGQAYKIMTGASVPADADTVIPVEKCEIQGDKVHFDVQDSRYGKHIARQGEDTQKGNLLADNSLKIDMPTATTLANLGYYEVEVLKSPKINIITTGNEVVSLGTEIQPLQIRNSNYFSILAGLKSLGMSPNRYDLVSDNLAQFKEILKDRLSCDVLIMTGAVSKGDADFVPQVLEELGAEKLFHRVAIRPGKPIWFGVKNQTVIFALPGNPLSAQVNFQIFVKPFLHRLLGLAPPLSYSMNLDSAVNTHPRLDAFRPAIFKNSETIELKKIKGSGDVTASLATEGFAFLPKNQENITRVQFFPWE